MPNPYQSPREVGTRLPFRWRLRSVLIVGGLLLLMSGCCYGLVWLESIRPLVSLWLLERERDEIEREVVRKQEETYGPVETWRDRHMGPSPAARSKTHLIPAPKAAGQ